MLLTLVLLTASVLDTNPPRLDGVIEGVVVRAADQRPVSGAEVVLRAKVDGQLLPVAETAADAQGKFRFGHLPADGEQVYLPGANRDGVHYPGPSVRLSPLQPRAEVKLAVYDALAFPNPLVVRRHTIALRPEPGLLRVTETMLIDNPGTACYVGQAAGRDAAPVTLQLGIPANFAQVTFGSEFFGRRFSLIGGKLATGVPWPPGQRELTFSYVLTNAGAWQRPLDLPSTGVRVLVGTGQPDSAAAHPNRVPGKEDDEVAFRSGGRTLPAGYLLRVELDHLPSSAMAYAPWGAIAALAGLIVVTTLPLIRRRDKEKRKGDSHQIWGSW
jgi:hypothetical protein